MVKGVGARRCAAGDAGGVLLVFALAVVKPRAAGQAQGIPAHPRSAPLQTPAP